MVRHLTLAGGLAQLGLDLGLHVVDLVHHLHGTLASRPPPLGAARLGPAPAPPVYDAVRSGFALAQTSVAHLGRLLAPDEDDGVSDLLPLQSALNGILGQRLAASGNPLALPLSLQRMDPSRPDAPTLVFLHGLCMSELGWQRGAHPAFVARMRDAGGGVVYCRYNTGLRISQNGAELARQLESLAGRGPLWLVGHSMGGLVARSALHQAREARLVWSSRVRGLVTLGSPHDGAALERLGNHANRLLRLSPYTAPFSRLGNLRSDGIRDLRHGNLLECDWRETDDPDHVHDPRRPVPLAAGVRHLFVAASRSPDAGAPAERLRDDLLVSVPSALAHGHHRSAPIDRIVLHDLDHMGLLGSRRVHALLERIVRMRDAGS